MRRILLKRVGSGVMPEAGVPVVMTLDELVKPREKLSPKQSQQLDWIKRKFPDLLELYLLKEDLRNIMQADSRDKAEQEISRWLMNAQNAANAEGPVWVNTMRSWRQELLNLAQYTEQGRRYTNGYIEGKITLIKMVKRLGFGFRS